MGINHPGLKFNFNEPNKDVKKHGHCVTDKDCPSYSHCYKKSCTCRFEYHGDGMKCKADPPKQCSSDEDCPGKSAGKQHAKCGVDNKCRCVGMYAGNGDYCRAAKSCPKNAKCGSNAYCMIDPLLPNSHLCPCKEGFWKEKNGKCIECLSNVDCNYDENSATCVKGECKCKDELIREGKKCKPAPIQVCRADFDCHNKAKCLKGKCICQGWYIGNGKYCRASQPCRQLDHCGSHGECLLDPLLLKTPHCRCEEGYEVFNESGKCLECLSNKECNTDYSTCVDGECKCKDELIKEGRTCRHHSLPCPEGFRCGKHSTCVVDPLFPKTPDCKCDSGYKKSNGSCVGMSNCEKKGLDCPNGAICGTTSGGSIGCVCVKGYKTIFKKDQLMCEDIDECATGKARCSGDRCTNTVGSYTCIPCPFGFTDGADGLCVGTFKGACKCKKHEECRRGKCKCKTGYKRTEQGQCVRGNRDGLEVQPSSGNSSHFACHLSVFMALGLLGRLAFLSKEE
ncbi:hypothetical protein ACROYT_G023890 [Oculina patagonica]